MRKIGDYNRQREWRNSTTHTETRTLIHCPKTNSLSQWFQCATNDQMIGRSRVWIPLMALENFGNFGYSLYQCLSEETIKCVIIFNFYFIRVFLFSHRVLSQGRGGGAAQHSVGSFNLVSMPVKKPYLSWTPPPLLEKDNFKVNPRKNTENLSVHSIRKTNKKNGCITGDSSSTNYYWHICAYRPIIP